MGLLNLRECGREWCLDRTLRFTMRTFDTGAQLPVDHLHGIAVDADLPSPAVDFLERFLPPSRAREHGAARKGFLAGDLTVLAWQAARAA